MDDDIIFGGAARQAELIRNGAISSRELTAALLARIDRYDPVLNAFSVVLGEQALAEAERRDAETRSGDLPPLHGVAVAIKEEIDVAGCVTTFGGRGNSTPAAADGEVVRRLRDAGAVIIGKTTMPEFGQWPFTESVAHGITRNPWNVDHSTGGSSGGTAAAVAAGLVPVGIGGDGGGSIRIPSACCGLFGLKPQRGRVTSSPQPHLWWGLGTVGPLTRRVIDSALVYDAIRGNVPGDRFRADEPPMSFVEAALSVTRPLRIAWSTKPGTKGFRPDPVNVCAVHDTVTLLEGLGHQVTEIDPDYPDATAAFVPQLLGGVRAEAGLVEHPERLERRTKEMLRLGFWVSDRVVEWAMRQGAKIAERTEKIFDSYDVLLTPSILPRPPEVGVLDGIGALRASVVSMPMIGYAAMWNITGNPAASVPVGFGPDGLPLGVQIVGRQHDEATLLALAAQLEQAQPWADARPPL
jgi:amidase